MKKLTVKLAVILFILLLVSIAFSCAAPVPETVVFPDENLEAVIRDALDKPEGDITPAELAELTMLSARYQGITDLSGIEYCTNLTWLELARNYIRDASPLSPLTNLTYLSLRSNEVSDISPLASLTKLSQLELSRNRISDISPLVENSGLSEKDLILLTTNNLDLSEGSEDLENIRILEERGVKVLY